MSIPPVWTCLFVTLLVTLVLLQPMLRYIKTGWRAKRKDIMDSLSPKARFAYYLMFGCGEKRPNSQEEACKNFEDLYSEWYGRRHFTLPAILFGLTGLASTAAVVISAL